MTITNVKGILDRKLTGASIDDIQGISDYSLFKEAAVNLLNEIDPAETKRRTTINVFGTVYDYAPPADIKSIYDIRKQANRGVSDNPTRRYSEDFDINKNSDDFTLEWLDATRILRYSKNIGNTAGIHTMESLTANGTWDGTAANIAVSTFNPFKGSGAIQADFDTGEYIENFPCIIGKQDEFKELIEEIYLSKNTEQKLINRFIKLLQSSFSNLTVNKKIETWYEMKFGEFRKELEKQKIAIPIKQ